MCCSGLFLSAVLCNWLMFVTRAFKKSFEYLEPVVYQSLAEQEAECIFFKINGEYGLMIVP